MKIFFGTMFFLLSLFTISFAQNEIKYIDTKLDSKKLKEANADLSQIEIDFCDKPEQKTITYTLVPGSKQDICLKAMNMSDRDIWVTIEFVDGTFTNDQRKNKACMNQGENKNFGKYVTGFTSSFVVGANNIYYNHAKLQLPKNQTGVVYGCLVYYTKGVEMGGKLNFTVLMRKAKFIDVHIIPNTIKWNKILLGISICLLCIIVFKIFIYKKKLPHTR